MSMGKGGKRLLLALCMTLALGGAGSRACAESFYENPNITLSPDKKAWTVAEELPPNTDPKNWSNPPCWYPEGEQVLTGIKSTLHEPKKGEHFYQYQRTGILPIGRWEVVYRTARCIHPDYPPFHGMNFTLGVCNGCYYSGWNAMCADCGEALESGYIYMSRSAIKTLKEIDLDLDYYYGCPNCGHLEQGRGVTHKCKGVSANRYRVVYHANASDAAGTMQDSFHMYNNAEMYEGQKVTPVKKLSLNGFKRSGYRFTGWNTKPGGGGTAYTDGQEIRNLTEENYDPESGKGTIHLYAQWKKTKGTLVVDPGDGKYKGESGTSKIEVGYNETVQVRSADVTPPTGALVSFNVMGGKEISAIRDKLKFTAWKLSKPAHGVLSGEAYTFLGENGETDYVTAKYQRNGIELPEAEKEGYSFAGWYLDEEFAVLAGRAGDTYSTAKNVTLYARWVDLALTAKVNLTAHSGSGAIDLKWTQPDGNKKVYLVYRKMQGGEFVRLYGSDDVEIPMDKVSYAYTKKDAGYQVPASGFYKLEVFGAQGSTPGTGEIASKKFYLEKDDILTIKVGVKGNNEYGGGRTVILSKKEGMLLFAGVDPPSGATLVVGGSASVKPVNIGFHSSKKLKGTVATDFEAPLGIDAESVKKEAAADGTIRLLFTPPKDRGTVYYHQVESYQKGSQKLLTTSNITETEVATGVAGYYYRINAEETDSVTAETADNAGNPLVQPELGMAIPEKTQYVHLAAVDRAGNVGPTLSVKIAPEDIELAWKLHTEQMTVGSIVEDYNYRNVVWSEGKTYYVRADGKTPFLLKYAATMAGKPRADYQIDRAGFVFSVNGSYQGQYTLLLPRGSLAQTETTDARQWERISAGNVVLQASMYGKASRTKGGRKLEIAHSFTLDPGYHAKSIFLSPTVGAAYGDGIEYSDPGEDAAHGITLIGDGEGPRIYGMDRLDRLTDDADRRDLWVDLQVRDMQSGVETFYAVLRNTDNFSEAIYYPGSDGHIRIDLSEDSPLFFGNMKLTAYAKDKVGNETLLEKDLMVLGLSAKVVRMLPPHLPEFKRGESGWLEVTAWGFVEHLEIRFPRELTSGNPSLRGLSFHYEIPKMKQEEKIDFMIPLYLTESKEYQITVRAFKRDEMLERHPVLCTLRVEDTVLDEIRTRLR